MPTAARLFAAISRAMASFGGAIGWTYMGMRARAPLSNQISNGITATLMLAVGGLLLVTFLNLFRLSLFFGRVWNVDAALAHWFYDITTFGSLLLRMEILTLLAVGGPIGGLLTWLAHKRWPT